MQKILMLCVVLALAAPAIGQEKAPAKNIETSVRVPPDSGNAIVFLNPKDKKEIGRLILADKLRFEGKAEESAVIFFQNVVMSHDQNVQALQRRVQQLTMLVQLYGIPLPAELK